MIQRDSGQLNEIQRVNVIGTSGSGKSTLARKMSELLDLPLIEMDAVYWGPNWTEPTDDVYLPKIKNLTEKTRWVLDGNYSRTTQIKWRYVQLVVWVDMSFLRTIYRVSSRCVKRAITQTEIWPGTGNRETLRKGFLSTDSVILWAITSYRRNRQRYEVMMGSPEYSHIWFERLRTPGAVSKFLDELPYFR